MASLTFAADRSIMKRDVSPYDLIIDQENYIYMVTTYSDVPDVVVCTLKYVPFARLLKQVLGYTWYVNGEPYTKIATEDLEAQFHSSQYCFYNPHLKLTLFEIPVHRIKRIIHPATKVSEILDENNPGLDQIRQAAFDLLTFMIQEVGIDISRLGITGSILLNAHIPQISDVDLVMEGAENYARYRDYIRSAVNDSTLPRLIQMKNDPNFWETYSDLRYILKAPIEVYARRAAQKMNKGWVNSIPFSIFAFDEQLSPHFNLSFKSKAGRLKFRGVVVDDAGSELMPSVCRVLVNELELNDTGIPDQHILGQSVSVESWCIWYVGHMLRGEVLEVEGALFKDATTLRVIVTTSGGYVA